MHMHPVTKADKYMGVSEYILSRNETVTFFPISESMRDAQLNFPQLPVDAVQSKP